MRGRSYSYSPSPPRGYGRRYRSPSPRGRYSREKDLPTSLLVRNLRHDCRLEFDLAVLVNLVLDDLNYCCAHITVAASFPYVCVNIFVWLYLIIFR